MLSVIQMVAVCLGLLTLNSAPPKEPWHGSVNELSVPFPVLKGRLGIMAIGEDFLPTDVLAFVPSDTKKPQIIRNLNALKGRVSILNAKAALRYVRLLTAPLLACQMREVVAYSWVDKEFFFGNEILYNVAIGEAHYGFFGIVSPSACRWLGVSPPSVQEAKGGFRVTRTLSDDDGFPFKTITKVYHVVEFVGKDGNYLLEKKQEPPNLKDWSRYVRVLRRK